MIKILPFDEARKILQRRAGASHRSRSRPSRPILEAVRKRGDKAVLEYARKFDGYKAQIAGCPESDA